MENIVVVWARVVYFSRPGLNTFPVFLSLLLLICVPIQQQARTFRHTRTRHTVQGKGYAYETRSLITKLISTPLNVRRVPTFIYLFFFFFTANYTRLFFPATETERIRVRYETNRYCPVRVLDKIIVHIACYVDRKQYVHHTSVVGLRGLRKLSDV